MVDYSKWDRIDDDEEPVNVGKVTSKGSEKGRYEFRHDGKLIYEWEQTLDEVNIYVKPPPVTSDMIECKFKPSRVTVGLRGNPPFIDEATYGPIVVEESYWTLADGELSILLQKMRKGETWEAALVGRGTVDPFTKQEIQKEMMLERFQEENPGFDFSGADFNGSVPDPRSFMDGIKYA